MPTFMLAVIGLVLFWTVPPMVNVATTIMLMIQARGAQIRPQDASHRQIAPPEIIQPAVTALTGMGFVRVGEAGQKAYEDEAGPAQIWYFADRAGTTCAGVFTAQNQPYGTVYSWFGDRAVIVTGWRQGVPVHDPDFRYQVVTDSLESAYTQHLAQLPDFVMRYGEPVKLTSMNEILRLDAVYNAKFAARRLQPDLRRHLIGLMIRVYGLFIVGLGAYMLAATDLPPIVVTLSGILLFIPAYLLNRRVSPRPAGRP